MLAFVANHRVVDISKRKPGTVPAIDKTTPRYKVVENLMEMKRLSEWSELVKKVFKFFFFFCNNFFLFCNFS